MKQLGELSVGEYMTRQTVCICNTDRLTEAVRLMDTKRLSVLPVMDEQGHLIGILSTSDLVEITHEIQSDLNALTYVTEKTREFLIKLLIDQGDTTLVRDIMTSPVETITLKTNLVVAARKLVNRHYHHLPVVDDSGTPIGILSTSDFVRDLRLRSNAGRLSRLEQVANRFGFTAVECIKRSRNVLEFYHRCAMGSSGNFETRNC